MTLAPAATTLPQRIDAALAEFLDDPGVLMPDPQTGPMLAALRRFVLNGGKRLRPGFCYWAWRGVAAAEHDGPAVVAGAALELFHCFALIHDDIIDGSSSRRGEPSLHETFAAQHAEQGWRADPAQFGRNVALLCGDLCAVWAEQLLAGCGAAAPRLRAAQRLFATMRAEAITGEYLDVMAQAAGDPQADTAMSRALQIIQLKTARYSVVRPLQIGALLAGADSPLLRGYAAFGEPLGEAFQLRDDVLGVFGDPASTGKPVLDDLRQAKPTVLLALTFANADARQLAVLESLVGDPELDHEGAQCIRQVMTDCGALQSTESRILRAQGEALKGLAALDISAEAKQALGDLAVLAVARSA